VRISREFHELLQALLQPGTDNAGCILFLLQKLRRYNHVGIDRPQRYVELLRSHFTPPPRLAQGILVADHQRRLDLLAEPH
jgi:hypothetical protein